MAGVAITSGPNVPHAGARRPNANTLRQRAWTTMRIQRAFTITDLLVASTQGGERNATGNLRRYLTALARVGVVRRVAGTRPTSNGFLKYQLLGDLGEIAPTLRPQSGVLYDHNSLQELEPGVTDRRSVGIRQHRQRYRIITGPALQHKKQALAEYTSFGLDE